MSRGPEYEDDGSAIKAYGAVIASLKTKEPQATTGVSPMWYWMGHKYAFSNGSDEWFQRMANTFLPDFVFDKLTGCCLTNDWGRFYHTREEAMEALNRVRRSLEPITVGPIPGYDFLVGDS